MCNKICIEKFRQQAKEFEVKKMIKNSQNLLYSNQVKLIAVDDEILKNTCKNCKFYQKNA